MQYLALIVLAVLSVGGLAAPAPAEARYDRDAPRYEKTKDQCGDYAPCLRDYYQRKRCREMSRGYKQKICYIVRAAKYYGESPARGIRAIKCESGPKIDQYASGAGGLYKGMGQFDKTTWNETPFRKYSRNSIEWAPMGLMWFWDRGEYSRWPRCAYA